MQDGRKADGYEGIAVAALGFGYEKVNKARRTNPAVDGILSTDSIRTMDTFGKLDLFAKLSYEHHGITEYGASLQYFNGGLFGEAYMFIFSWMRFELKYSRVVFRDLEPWEYQELIVPGIRLSWAF